MSYRGDLKAMQRASASSGSFFSPGFFKAAASGPAVKPEFESKSLETSLIGRTMRLPDTNTEFGRQRAERVVQNLQRLKQAQRAEKAESPKRSFQLLCSLAVHSSISFLLENDTNLLDMFGERPICETDGSNTPGTKRQDLFVLVEDIAIDINFECDPEWKDKALGRACVAVANAIDGAFDEAQSDA